MARQQISLILYHRSVNIYMRRVKYSAMKKDEYYATYTPKSTTKDIFIFQMADSQPIMGTFTIVRVIESWDLRLNHSHRNEVINRTDFATSINPDNNIIFELEPFEVNMHIIISRF